MSEQDAYNIPVPSEEINGSTFTFEDIRKLSPNNVQTIIKATDKDILPIALKGSSDITKKIFLSNMQEQEVTTILKSLKEMGAIKLSDVIGAQQSIVTMLKEMVENKNIEMTYTKQE